MAFLRASAVCCVVATAAAHVENVQPQPVCESTTDTDADGSCKLSTRQPVRDQLLLQLHTASSTGGGSLVKLNRSVSRSRVSSGLQARDAALAAHIRMFSRDASNVASVIQRGLTAILDSIVHFSASPPRIGDGIQTLGINLLAAVEALLPQGTGDGDFADFKNAWNSAFERIPGAVDSITADIDLYNREGDPPVLIRAIDSIIQEAGMIVVEFLPIQTGIEVSKYLNAVSETFDTLGISWDEFANGRIVDGIEAVYWGLRGITDGLMPEALKDNEIYNTVISALDLILGNLSQHVLEYERHILESSVCWRTEKMRERKRPSVCPAKYAWDGLADCYPLMTGGSFIQKKTGEEEGKGKGKHLSVKQAPADDYEQFGVGGCRAYAPDHKPSTWYVPQPDFEGSMEACLALCESNPRCKAIEYQAPSHCEVWTVEPQATSETPDANCYKKSGGTLVAGRPMPARCSNEYPEKHGQHCFDQCPGGFHQKHGTLHKCQSSCEGEYPAESPGMCAKSQGLLTKAILEMVTTILNSAFSLADNIIKMQEDGVNGELLSNTIQIFIDMGKPFANPPCPEWELPAIAPPASGPDSICAEPCGLEIAPGDCRLKSGDTVICLPASGGYCSEGQTKCDEEDTGSVVPAAPRTTVCTNGVKMYLSGHGFQQLQDNRGNVKFSPNSQGWEQWTLSDAGDGKVYITSHRWAQLQEGYGNVGLSWNKQGWEKWTISDAGNGKVYITSHSGKHLTNSHGHASVSSNKEAEQQWTLTDMAGAPGCHFF